MNNNSQILICQSPNGNISIDVRLEDDTVWLTQASMAELFQVKPQNITMHLKIDYSAGKPERNVRILMLLADEVEDADDEHLWLDEY